MGALEESGAAPAAARWESHPLELFPQGGLPGRSSALHPPTRRGGTASSPPQPGPAPGGVVRGRGVSAGKATGEDVALGRRVTDLGLEVAFVPGPVVHHQNNTGARDFLMKQWRLGRGCAVNFREGIQPFSFMDERRWTAGLLLAAVFPGRLLRIGWRSLRNREVGPLRRRPSSPPWRAEPPATPRLHGGLREGRESRGGGAAGPATGGRPLSPGPPAGRLSRDSAR